MEEIAFILGLSFGTFILFGYLLKKYEDTDDAHDKAKTSPPNHQPQANSNEAPKNPFGNHANLPEKRTRTRHRYKQDYL